LVKSKIGKNEAGVLCKERSNMKTSEKKNWRLHYFYLEFF